jgi:small-conductance mechanosensitive channel
MNDVTMWADLFLNSLQTFGNKFLGSLPSILGALIIFILGWLFAKFVSKLVSKLLAITKFDVVAEKLNVTDFLSKASISIAPSQLVGKFVYWILLLLVLITASDTLGWSSLSGEISRLIEYLPKLFVAIVLFVLGTYLATFVRDVIFSATRSLGISTGKIIGNFTFYLLFITVVLTALNQAGVNTSIITSNLTLILGAFLGAAALSYGLASRHVLSHVLSGYFNRRLYVKGMTIEVDGIKGIIQQTTNVNIILKDDAGHLNVIPMSTLLESHVKIYKD